MKVLIIDDSHYLLTGLMGILKEIKEIEIMGLASNSEEAMKILSKEEPDVITLDIRMPKENGIITLGKIKDLGIDAKIIMLTNYPYKHYEKACKKLGADYFLDKTKDIEKLVNILKGLAGISDPLARN